MFDLEAAIADWKQSLATRESLGTEDIAELETHLRESMSTLAMHGLNDEEAFIIARRRIGSTVDLGEEYAKENPSTIWVRRLKWMCLGYLLIASYQFLTSVLVNEVLTPLNYLNKPPESVLVPQYVYHLLFAVGQALSIVVLFVLGTLITNRRPIWLEQISSWLSRRPKHVLFGLLVGWLVLPYLLIYVNRLLFDFSGAPMIPLHALMLQLLYSLISPMALIAASSCPICKTGAA